MRHRKHSVKFGRQRSHYKATMKQLVSGLIISKGITTTKVKAKETSRLADRLVTIAKNGNVTARRRAYSILGDRDLVSILFNDIAPLFKERKGGYTRVMLTSRRRGDNAQMAILEFVEKPVSEPKAKAEKKPEPKPKPKPSIEKPKPERVEEKKKEPCKVVEPPKQPEEKPGFFKRLFGRKKDN
ncbi:MAG: 50S ribosomal protein L17 [Candidatus Omnitrophica bacterium]|nr:50S ribosomal protein L17 [Candidatus Omnitrophota bacterium]MBU4457448.1 50S ribosomal protein L17 [Candidatus Omnitrophota bacterium]